jgi:hypothetical protein
MIGGKAMSKGLIPQINRLLTKEGILDHHSMLLQNLLDYTKSQDKQIAALKAALIEERAQMIFYEPNEQGHLPQFDFDDLSSDSADVIRENAISQLARELPDIFGKEEQ